MTDLVRMLLSAAPAVLWPAGFVLALWKIDAIRTLVESLRGRSAGTAPGGQTVQVQAPQDGAASLLIGEELGGLHTALHNLTEAIQTLVTEQRESSQHIGALLEHLEESKTIFQVALSAIIDASKSSERATQELQAVHVDFDALHARLQQHGQRLDLSSAAMVDLRKSLDAVLAQGVGAPLKS